MLHSSKTIYLYLISFVVVSAMCRDASVPLAGVFWVNFGYKIFRLFTSLLSLTSVFELAVNRKTCCTQGTNRCLHE